MFITKFSISILLAVSFVRSSLVVAAEGNQMLGLIEIPSLFGTVDPSGPPGQTLKGKASSVQIRVRPSNDSSIAFELTKSGDVRSREHGYEEHSAVVFAKKKGWYLIASSSGQKGWLNPKDAGQFRTYKDLIEKDLAYLNGNWDGKMYSNPNKSAPFVVEENLGSRSSWSSALEASRSDVKVLGSKKVASQLWFKVEVVKGRCEGKETSVVAKGWVPGYQDSGEPNLWFYPRGC